MEGCKKFKENDIRGMRVRGEGWEGGPRGGIGRRGVSDRCCGGGSLEGRRELHGREGR